MSVRIAVRDIPTRLVTGAYILHTGLDKWKGDAERAARLHRTAANAFPFLRRIPPTMFLRMLATAEILTGGLLLAPIVPNRVAGGPLTVFSAGLVAMYLRTPSMHEPQSVWPTAAGIAVSKDAWLLSIGLNLLADGG